MKAATVAVDVGYGNTKFAFPMGSETKLNMFLSSRRKPRHARLPTTGTASSKRAT